MQVWKNLKALGLNFVFCALFPSSDQAQAQFEALFSIDLALHPQPQRTSESFDNSVLAVEYIFGNWSRYNNDRGLYRQYTNQWPVFMDTIDGIIRGKQYPP